MNDDETQAIHEAVDEALNNLAERLGGSSDTGGPVENATQITGRGDLGVLLTDAENRVLGRVWVEFGGGVDVPDEDLEEGGSVHVEAQVLAELFEPPVPLEDWIEGH